MVWAEYFRMCCVYINRSPGCDYDPTVEQTDGFAESGISEVTSCGEGSVVVWNCVCLPGKTVEAFMQIQLKPFAYILYSLLET